MVDKEPQLRTVQKKIFYEDLSDHLVKLLAPRRYYEVPVYI